jgi:microcystin-dependent protein
VLALEAKFAELEQGYTIDCLEGSPDPTNTYEVLQATINKLCALETDLAALALDVDTNYVKLSDLDALIQAYLDSTSPSVTQQYQKMVPYTVLEYYGDIAGNFSSTGIGIAAAGWDKVYLCNGLNGAPDKRGRSPIGSTSALMGGGPLDPIVAAGPAYGLQTPAGQSYVTLTTDQLPSHIHPNVLAFNDPQHTHNWGYGRERDDDGTGGSYDEFTLIPGLNGGLPTSPILPNTTGITCSLTNAPQGDNHAHNNIHPVLSCYYIIYIP